MDISVQYDAPYILVKFRFDQSINAAFKTEFRYVFVGILPEEPG